MCPSKMLSALHLEDVRRSELRTLMTNCAVRLSTSYLAPPKLPLRSDELIHRNSCFGWLVHDDADVVVVGAWL